MQQQKEEISKASEDKLKKELQGLKSIYDKQIDEMVHCLNIFFIFLEKRTSRGIKDPSRWKFWFRTKVGQTCFGKRSRNQQASR